MGGSEPAAATSLYDMLIQKSNEFPERCSIEYFGFRLTYRELIVKIDACANALSSRGIVSGDRIALCLPNIPEALMMIYAVNKIGAVSVMLHPLCSAAEAADTVAATSGRAVVCLDEHLNKFAGTTADFIVTLSPLQSLNPILRFLKGMKRLRRSVTNVVRWGSFMHTGNAIASRRLHPEDEALILGSGGTCGSPKKIILTNSSVNALALMVQSLNRTGCNDGLLCIMPVFHGFGLCFSIHAGLLGGKRCVLVPRYADLSFARILKRSKPAYLVGVPLLYERMLQNRHLRKADLHYVVGAACGGDSITERTYNKISAFLKRHGCDAELQIGYGLTECVTACTYTPEGEYCPGRVGVPFDGIQIMIAGEDGNELPPGSIGEIRVSGPTLMKGYHNDPAATADALYKDKNGATWLKTGDIGKIDENGFINYIQRKKRVFKISGYAVFPSVIEEALESYPGVGKACVVSIPARNNGERESECENTLIAFIEMKNTPRNLEAEVVSFCKKKLNPFSIPERVIPVNPLPLTRLKKIDTAALESLAEGLVMELRQ